MSIVRGRVRPPNIGFASNNPNGSSYTKPRVLGDRVGEGQTIILYVPHLVFTTPNNSIYVTLM